jgi:hypothetical protein
MTKPSTIEAPPLQEVILLKDGHTHQGRPRKKGDSIHVTAREAEWLAKRELIAPAVAADAASKGAAK